MPFDDLTGAKRQFYRFLFIALCFLMLADLGLHYNSSRDRAKTREINQQLLKQQVETEALHHRQNNLTDVRAKVAVMLLNAVAAGRTFTPEERQQITQLWHSAEFDKMQEKFLDEPDK